MRAGKVSQYSAQRIGVGPQQLVRHLSQYVLAPFALSLYLHLMVLNLSGLQIIGNLINGQLRQGAAIL